MSVRWQCLCIDAADPAAQAAWWATVLGWRVTVPEWADEHDGDVVEAVVEPIAGSPEDGVSPDLLFLRVPEGKTVKNRLHIDLTPDNQQAEVDRLLALGARHVDIGQDADPDCTWVVLADPEGNEFCVLAARS